MLPPRGTGLRAPDGDITAVCEYDLVGNAIYFESPTSTNGFASNANSRVGVTNVDFGKTGIDDETFVISFGGTPSQASRDNPVTPVMPLLFSARNQVTLSR